MQVLAAALVALFTRIIFLRSAAILAPPIPESEPALDITIDECDSGVADDFLPRKREKSHSIWFDVPNRGGIGMIHVAKRKCPEIMFRYLDYLSKEEGRGGWSFPAKLDDKLLSPAKVIQVLLFLRRARTLLLFRIHTLSSPHACNLCQVRYHQSRSGKTIFPPSPAACLPAGASPRFSKLGRELVHTPTMFNAQSPSDSSNDRLTRSSQRGYVSAPILVFVFGAVGVSSLDSFSRLTIARLSD